VSVPVGSAYPGNLVTSVFACFFLILSAKSALTAYRLRYGGKGPQSWERDRHGYRQDQKCEPILLPRTVTD
jgi:hypothetical protein